MQLLITAPPIFASPMWARLAERLRRGIGGYYLMARATNCSMSAALSTATFLLANSKRAASLMLAPEPPTVPLNSPTSFVSDLPLFDTNFRRYSDIDCYR